MSLESGSRISTSLNFSFREFSKNIQHDAKDKNLICNTTVFIFFFSGFTRNCGVVMLDEIFVEDPPHTPQNLQLLTRLLFNLPRIWEQFNEHDINIIKNHLEFNLILNYYSYLLNELTAVVSCKLQQNLMPKMPPKCLTFFFVVYISL